MRDHIARFHNVRPSEEPRPGRLGVFERLCDTHLTETRHRATVDGFTCPDCLAAV